MAMKLSTGKVAFPIEFDNGDKANIYFNPNDPQLFVRLHDFEARTQERFKELELDLTVDEKGEAVSENMIEELKKVNKIIFEEMDVAFNGDVSAVVFKHCSPFAIIGGEYFIMQFLKCIMPEITKHNQKASKEVAKKMAKHTAKYQKK